MMNFVIVSFASGWGKYAWADEAREGGRRRRMDAGRLRASTAQTANPVMMRPLVRKNFGVENCSAKLL